jgi:hypothetical protein
MGILAFFIILERKDGAEEVVEELVPRAVVAVVQHASANCVVRQHGPEAAEILYRDAACLVVLRKSVQQAVDGRLILLVAREIDDLPEKVEDDVRVTTESGVAQQRGRVHVRQRREFCEYFRVCRDDRVQDGHVVVLDVVPGTAHRIGLVRREVCGCCGSADDGENN